MGGGIEQILRKAKIDCLNLIAIGKNAAGLEYNYKLKILSVNNAINY